MSVVNRMLQDIDRRSGAAAIDARTPVPGVRSVPSPAARGARHAWIAGGIAVLVALGAMVAANWGPARSPADEPRAAPPRPVAQALPATAAPTGEPSAPSATAPEPSSGTPAVEEQPISGPAPSLPGALRPTLDYFKLSSTLSPPKTASSGQVAKGAATVPAKPAEAAPARAPANAKPSGEAAGAATAGARATGEVTRTPATAPSAVAVRYVAAAETVASARLLWEEGSRAGALATLREALAAAEDSGDREATRALARELAGMELASNRAQAALELLMRLSGLFGGDADALALRGNAQQRLALHAEAADSYLAALRLRPTEGKWMLGAAISLAALGRKAEAQAWVDRARERGAITPPIAAYLQQLGMATRP